MVSYGIQFCYGSSGDSKDYLNACLAEKTVASDSIAYYKTYITLKDLLAPQFGTPFPLQVIP